MTQGIAAAASLALAVKLKKMFEEEDKFLTFPIGLGFPANYFEFMKDPSETTQSAQEQVNMKADFARQMNMIPLDRPLFSPDGSQLVWDRIRDVLRDCVFAESALNEAEERRLAEAIAYLTDDEIGPDGLAVPVMSPQVRRYYEYKTLFEQAESAYLDEKLSVEFASGEERERLQQAWEAYREKQLRDARDRAEQDWINLGFKREVEGHMATRNGLEMRKHLHIIREVYLSEMRISEINDLNGHGIGYLNTFFSPLDSFEPSQTWASITLTKSEMAGLIREAPEELRAIFGRPSPDDIPLEAISLEYNKVVLVRPWLRFDFFTSRYWRLRDDRLLCDGGLPRGGPLPAFVTSLIVARNVSVVRRKDAPAVTPSATIPLQLVSTQVFAPAAAAVARDPGVTARPAAATVTPAVVMARPSPTVAARPAPARPLVHERSTFVHAAPEAAVVRDHRTAAVVRDHRTAPVVRDHRTAPVVRDHRATPVVRDHRAAPVVRDHRAAPVVRDHRATPVVRDHRTDAGAVVRPYEQLARAGTTIRTPVPVRLPQRRPEEDVRLQPSQPETVTETIRLDGFNVLALACKRLPRCPDPDPALQWLGTG